jgi:hypothetical protein
MRGSMVFVRDPHPLELGPGTSQAILTPDASSTEGPVADVWSLRAGKAEEPDDGETPCDHISLHAHLTQFLYRPTRILRRVVTVAASWSVGRT